MRDQNLSNSAALPSPCLLQLPACLLQLPACLASAQVSATLLHFGRKPPSLRENSVPPGGVSNQSEVWHLFSTVCRYIFQIGGSLNTTGLIASADLWPLSRIRESLSQAIVLAHQRWGLYKMVRMWRASFTRYLQGDQ